MRRLYTRIYLQMLLVLVVSAVAVWLVVAIGYRGEYGRGFGHRLTSVAATVIAERFDDPAARRRAVVELSGELGLALTLRDLDGRVLAVAGEPLPPVSAREVRALGRREHLVVHGSHPFAAAIVRGSDGRALGVLQAGLPAPATSWLFQHLALIAVILLVIALLARPLARRISMPVERLTEATRRFGRGELGYRIRPAPAGRRGDELVRLEQAWDDMAGRIESLVRSHRELLANVSHELRSPLARLRVLLELLPSSPEVAVRAGEIEREVADLDRLVDALLTVARLEAAALPVSRERVGAAALLESVKAMGRADPALADVAVELRGGDDLAVEGDPALLRRALWNLLENAAKYGAPPITLFAEAEGDTVRVGVGDLGPGIDPAERERLLAPFARGREPAARERPGVGLGLTLANQIAAAHGGALRVEPAIVDAAGERGCRVSVTLRRASSEPASATGASSAGAGPTS